MSAPYGLHDCACNGGETRTRHNAMGDMEECVVCHTAVAWDFVEHPFFGFSADGLCKTARKLAADDR